MSKPTIILVIFNEYLLPWVSIFRMYYTDKLLSFPLEDYWIIPESTFIIQSLTQKSWSFYSIPSIIPVSAICSKVWENLSKLVSGLINLIRLSQTLRTIWHTISILDYAWSPLEWSSILRWGSIGIKY